METPPCKEIRITEMISNLLIILLRIFGVLKEKRRSLSTVRFTDKWFSFKRFNVSFLEVVKVWKGHFNQPISVVGSMDIMLWIAAIYVDILSQNFLQDFRFAFLISLL